MWIIPNRLDLQMLLQPASSFTQCVRHLSRKLQPYRWTIGISSVTHFIDLVRPPLLHRKRRSRSWILPWQYPFLKRLCNKYILLGNLNLMRSLFSLEGPDCRKIHISASSRYLPPLCHHGTSECAFSDRALLQMLHRTPQHCNSEPISRSWSF